jgi:hypothetical protein
LALLPHARILIELPVTLDRTAHTEILNVAKTCGIPGFRYVFFTKPLASIVRDEILQPVIEAAPAVAQPPPEPQSAPAPRRQAAPVQLLRPAAPPPRPGYRLLAEVADALAPPPSKSIRARPTGMG